MPYSFPMIQHRLILALLVAIVTGACNRSDETVNQASPPPATTPAAAPASNPTAAAASGYPPTTQPGRILAGDLLQIDVAELTAPGTTTVLAKQVASDGTISMPGLSKPLAVAGMTDGAAEKAIADLYRENNIILSACIDVRRIRIAGTGGPAPRRSRPTTSYGSLSGTLFAREQCGLTSPGSMATAPRTCRTSAR